MSNVARFCLLSFALLTAASTSANERLTSLYEKIRQQSSEEALYNDEREARFRQFADERAQMLRDVEASVAQLERRKDALKSEFDENEDLLAELSTQLDRSIGDLGELFGVFRQTADDTQTLLFDSLITLEDPDRREEASRLTESREVPTIGEIQTLWRLLSQEIALSAEVKSFTTDVIEPGGLSYEAVVTRVGLFNIVTENKYLNYLPEQNVVTELPRQPALHVRRTAELLSEADNLSVIEFAIDPSRGALLGLLVQSPSLIERIQQGRYVGYAIIIVGAFGLMLSMACFLRLTSTNRRIKNQMSDLDKISEDNPLGRIMAVYYENEHLNDLEVIARKLEEVVISAVAEVNQGLSTIKVLAAIAPLMGLLGTVTGMIGTFQAITLFGTGDPKLMAGGISQALVTTVLGLCAAIPLLLSHSILNTRAVFISKVIGEQAAGMMAEKAVNLAKDKQSK